MLKLIVALATFGVDSVLAQAPGAEQYVVPAKFPSSIFKSYYVPASPTQNPQPAVHDPVLDIVRLRGWGGLPTFPAADDTSSDLPAQPYKSNHYS